MASETRNEMLSNGLVAQESAVAVLTNRTCKPRHSLQLCTLCNRTMNSDRQVQAHFAGVSHLSQLQARGLPLPPNTDMEKLQKATAKAANRPAGSSRPRPQWTGVQNGVPYQSYPMQHATPIQHSQFNGESCQVLTCRVCSLGFNSAQQAGAHYSGRKHILKMNEHGYTAKPSSSQFYDVPQLQLWPGSNHCHMQPNTTALNSGTNHLSVHACPVMPTQKLVFAPLPLHSSNNGSTNAHNFHEVPVSGIACSPSASSQLRPANLPKNVVLCEICQQYLNSESQANAHFNGAPHQRKCSQLSMYMQSVSGPHNAPIKGPSSSIHMKSMCLVCRVTVNSAKQFEIHEQGRLHQSRVRGLGSVAPQAEDKAITNSTVETCGNKSQNLSITRVVDGETGQVESSTDQSAL